MADVNLQIVASLVDNASSALKGVGDSMSNTAKSLDGIKASAQNVAISFGLMSAAILGPIGLMVKGASDEQASLDLLTATLQNQKDAATSTAESDQVMAQQKKLLNDQIDANKQKIDDLTAKVDRGKITWADYNAQVDKLNQNNDKLGEKLTLISGRMQASTMNVDQATKSFEALAQKNTDLGFKVNDSIQAFNTFAQAGLSVDQSTQAINLAMDLAVAKHKTLQEAAEAIGKVYNGAAGPALKAFGITLKDNLTPTQALAILQQRVGGDAVKMSTSLERQGAITQAKLDELSDTLGTTLIPALTSLLKALQPIIEAVTNFAKAHPTLTLAIMGTVTAIGLILGFLATMAGAIAGAISLFGAMASAADLLGAAFLFLSANPIVLIIAAVVALIAIIVLLIMNWKSVEEWVIKVWTNIQAFLKPAFEWLGGAWNAMWQGISDFFTQIWKGINDTFTGMINGIKNGFQSLFSFVQGIINQISSAANAVGSFVSGAAKGATSGIGAAVSALGAIHLASGGIVSSPTFALIGESGPEAVVPLSGNMGGGIGGAGNITININGGMFNDQNGARQIANTIAKLINQQLKLRTF